MPTFNFYSGHYSPGNACTAIFSARVNARIQGEVVSGITLTNANGYREIRWQSTSGPNIRIYHYQIWSLSAAQEAPAQWFLQQPGWVNTINMNYANATANETWAARLTQLQNDWSAVKALVVDTWSPSFVSGQTVVQIQAGGNKVGIALAYYSITTDAGVYIDLSLMYGYNVDGAPVIQTADTPGYPNASVGLSAVFPAAQLDKIVTELQQIADTDYNISINHGASIFSVKGKVTT